MLLDIWMPDTDGVTLLREWAATGQLTMPVVMMSGHGTIETAVEATKIGAFDFLEKPVGLQKLLSTIARALKTAAAQEPRRVSLAALGTSAADARSRARARAAARARNRPVLILGEPGTGHDARGARAARCRTRRSSRSPTARGSRPIRSRCSRRRATACSTAPRSASTRKAEQKGLAFLLPKLDKHNVDARLHQQRAARQPRGRGQVRRGAAVAAVRRARCMLPPLRARREDIPALIERFWRETNDGERAPPLLAALPPAALTALANALLAGQSRPPARASSPICRSCAARSPPST